MPSEFEFSQLDFERFQHSLHGARLAATGARTRMGARLASAITYPDPASPPGDIGVASTNAADAAAGTGARTLTIDYWASAGGGATFLWKRLTGVPLNGVSFVDLSTRITDFYRVKRIVVTEAGSGGANAGDITLQDALGTVVYGGVEAGTNACSTNTWVVTTDGARVMQKVWNSPAGNFTDYDDAVIIEIFGHLAGDALPRRIGFGTGSSTDFIIRCSSSLLAQWSEVYAAAYRPDAGSGGDVYFVAQIYEDGISEPDFSVAY